MSITYGQLSKLVSKLVGRNFDSMNEINYTLATELGFEIKFFKDNEWIIPEYENRLEKVRTLYETSWTSLTGGNKLSFKIVVVLGFYGALEITSAQLYTHKELTDDDMTHRIMKSIGQ